MSFYFNAIFSAAAIFESKNAFKSLITAMGKRRGGKKSEKARLGTAEPEAEHSGSEEEPQDEPPTPSPYVRLSETEVQTDINKITITQVVKETQTDLTPLSMYHIKEAAKVIRNVAADAMAEDFSDAETQTEDIYLSTTTRTLTGFEPQNEQDGVVISLAALENKQIKIQCAACEAHTALDVKICLALCATIPCQRCGHPIMAPF